MSDIDIGKLTSVIKYIDIYNVISNCKRHISYRLSNVFDIVTDIQHGQGWWDPELGCCRGIPSSGLVEVQGFDAIYDYFHTEESNYSISSCILTSAKTIVPAREDIVIPGKNCKWCRYTIWIHYVYDEITTVSYTLDGAALRDLVNSNTPEAPPGHVYVLAGFSFHGSVLEDYPDYTETINNNVKIKTSSSTSNPTLEDVFFNAFDSNSSIDVTHEFSFESISPTNSSCYTYPDGKTQCCVRLPRYLAIHYVLHSLTQVEEPPSEEVPEEEKEEYFKTPKFESSYNVGGLSGTGLNHISYGDDSIDILYIPSSLAIYDATGTYIGDAPYDQVDGIVVSEDGVFYYPHVRINRITDSFSEAGIMEFTQYTKFDDTPYFKEGQLVYGVIYGQVLFGGFIKSVSYDISEGEQLIKYTAVSFRKDFEESPWVFNYKDFNVTTTELLGKILSAAPHLFCRGRSGSLPKQTIPEVNFINQTIGDGLNFLFSAAGTYGWHLGPDKIFKIYNLQNLPIEDIYVAQEGNKLSDNPEYKVISMNLNYNLSDRITRLIIRGDFKRDINDRIIEDSNGNPTYLLYDTGWKGTAYTEFNVQHTKTLIDDRFKYTEGSRDDSPLLKQYAEQYLRPFKDAYIGGSLELDGVFTNFTIGKSVRIYNTNLNYLNNQVLIIYDIEYDLNNKVTRLSLSSNYWFGTDITKYFATIEKKIDSLDRQIRNSQKEDDKRGGTVVGQIINITSSGIYPNGRLYHISSESINKVIQVHSPTTNNSFRKGDYVSVSYLRIVKRGHEYSYPYNKVTYMYKIR